MGLVRERIVEAGLCPSCGAPATEYEYVVEGPLESGGSTWARIIYNVRCAVCKYSETKKIMIPLKALYSLRYLISPTARIAIEKIWLVKEVKEGKVRAGSG